ncbi:MAG: leucine-rich repeat domain-containing protein [Candidatus Babeliales bacterium]
MKIVRILLCALFCVESINARSVRELEEINIENDKVNLSNKNLTSLDGLNDLPTLARITHLNLSNNKLKTLPNNIFDKLPNLESINLSFNELTTLNPSIFKSLKNLTYLHLGKNHLSEKTIQGITQTLPNNITIDSSGQKVAPAAFNIEELSTELQQLNQDLEQLTKRLP